MRENTEWDDFVYLPVEMSDCRVSLSLCSCSSHFQIAFCIPEEDGYTVYSSSAWPSFTQAAVANILGIPASRSIF